MNKLTSTSDMPEYLKKILYFWLLHDKAPVLTEKKFNELSGKWECEIVNKCPKCEDQLDG